MKLHIINGPNLNLLGTREVDIYGSESFESYLDYLRKQYPHIELSYFQSNIEGEIIDNLQSYSTQCDGIIINPAGYSHTSVAIADAIAAILAPCVEVHISNIYAREEFRHTSYTAAKCCAVISGAQLQGYELALLHLQMLKSKKV
jgi:3-dehydroquinate dehydratase II